MKPCITKVMGVFVYKRKRTWTRNLTQFISRCLKWKMLKL